MGMLETSYMLLQQNWLNNMEKKYIYLKKNFFKIFFFSLFLTVISIFYEHYGWAIPKIPESIQIGLFSTKEEGSINCGGLPLPYAFDWGQVVLGSKGNVLSLEVIIYKSIFIIDIILWMIILTLLFSWLKELKSNKISKKEDKK